VHPFLERERAGDEEVARHGEQDAQVQRRGHTGPEVCSGDPVRRPHEGGLLARAGGSALRGLMRLRVPN
jgi:hypothetical protein